MGGRVSAGEWLLLWFISVATLAVAILDFDALKEGKLAVVEPVLGLELPVTVIMSVFVAGEVLASSQIALIVLVFLGIALAAATRLHHLAIHRRILEKGVLLALVVLG